MMIKTVTIDEVRFKEIYKGYLKYIALENGGVDNWAWYSDSLQFFLKHCYLENHPDKNTQDFYDAWLYDFDEVVKEDLKTDDFTLGMREE